MSVDELKSEFHKLIDNFDDMEILNSFYQAILEYSRSKRKTDIIDELSNVQRKRLMESIKQAEEGKTMSNEMAKDEIRKWLTK